jgi:hypothetical protein
VAVAVVVAVAVAVAVAVVVVVAVAVVEVTSVGTVTSGDTCSNSCINAYRSATLPKLWY